LRGEELYVAQGALIARVDAESGRIHWSETLKTPAIALMQTDTHFLLVTRNEVLRLSDGGGLSRIERRFADPIVAAATWPGSFVALITERAGANHVKSFSVYDSHEREHNMLLGGKLSTLRPGRWDELIVLGSEDGVVRVLDKTLTVRQTFRFPSAPRGLLTKHDSLYVGLRDGQLWKLDSVRSISSD